MCTVTYLPFVDGFTITSNRDEYFARKTHPPQKFDNGLVYPKDALAGGTWIAAHTNGRVACLLNGAFEKHKHQPPYSKSRGLILLESFAFDDAENFAQNIDLTGVEPFTLILADANKLIEFRWDETQKHIAQKDKNQPHLWASATLYGPLAQQNRQAWFAKWLQEHATAAEKNILAFHTSQHGHDIENDVVMERPNGVKTVSVSKVQVAKNNSLFTYVDLLTQRETIVKLI